MRTREATNTASAPPPRRDGGIIRFGVFSCVAVLLAHGLVYFLHEYSHSFAAWLLGWKAHPFQIDYGAPTVLNILFQSDVGDGVDYAPIFQAGRGGQAALIALAGLVFGNVLPYLLVHRMMASAVIGANRPLLAGLYWIALMCAGNVWSYVPTRALTTHADIALAAQGFGLAPLQLFPFVLVPALALVSHFFLVTYRRHIAQLTAGEPAAIACVVLLSTYWFFAYFGSAGYDGGYGPVSQALALLSRCVLFPLAGMWMWIAAAPADAA
nr:hypothetical protein [uncultured Massilia sp.]